jgi:hypothetical protein
MNCRSFPEKVAQPLHQLSTNQMPLTKPTDDEIITNRVRFNMDETELHSCCYSDQSSVITDYIPNNDLEEETVHPYFVQKQSKKRNSSSNINNTPKNTKSIFQFIKLFFIKKIAKFKRNDDINPNQLKMKSNDEIDYENLESCGSSISSFSSLLVEHHTYV